MIAHSGEFADGTEWAVEVTESRVFQAFDVAGLERFEVCAAEGAVSANWHVLPGELTPMQAAVVSALVLEAVS